MGVEPIALGKRISLLSRLRIVFGRSALLKLFCICTLLLIFFSLLLYQAERSTGDMRFNTYGKTLRTILILFISGFEIDPPETLLGTFATFAVVVLGISFLGLFIAEIASGLVVKKLRGRTGMTQLALANHILICGWTKDVPALVEQILSDDVKTRKDIVIIDELLDQCPIDDPNVHFVKGDPTETETLQRACIGTADTAILLADKSAENRNLEDSKNILIALAVETLNRDVHTCVELLNPKNHKHLERAHVDEIICTTEIGNRIILQSALNHGLSRFFNKITSFGEGSEIYKVKLASRLADKSFTDLLALLSREHKMILLAVEQDGELLINPQHEVTVQKGAHVYVLAEKFPREIEA